MCIFYRSGRPERTEFKICGVWSVPWGKDFTSSSTSNFASSSDSISSFCEKMFYKKCLIMYKIYKNK